MDKIRVAALQYFIRPVQSFEQFRDQVEGLVDAAVDSRCRLVVFPEYFTLQMITLGNVKRPMPELVRDVAARASRFVEAVSHLAKTRGIHIVAGTIPTMTDGVLHNDCHVFGPDGRSGIQGKLFMTRFESEEWLVTQRRQLRVFDADFGRFAVAICYDAEFPEVARAAARAGATLLVVPSCTEDRQGFLRVRYCAQARAIENQMYVIHAVTVGSLPAVPGLALNYGRAAILTPSDYGFPRDGILAEGEPNQEMMVIGDLDLAAIVESRKNGTVLPFRDGAASVDFDVDPEPVRL